MNDDFFKKLSEEEKPEYRRWARDNYRAGSEIKAHWHPVVREECRKMLTEFVDAFAEVLEGARTTKEGEGR
jgi:hypothetical protein